MTRTYIPCEDCFASLLDVNATISTLWLSLCDLADPREPYITVEMESRQLQRFLLDISILEELGFIVSHEPGTPKFYVIKVLGFERGCICVHNH